MNLIKKRLLIADRSETFIQECKLSPEAEKYHIESATSGTEAIEKIEQFKPDLVLIDLMLPEMHGIEILKRIRGHDKKMGVIISCSYAMIQSYNAAMKEGANYFLTKPFPPASFFTLAEQFFSHTLHPNHFSAESSQSTHEAHCYMPKTHTPDSYLKFWGTRGSNPVSGCDYIRFGGNTVCLEVRHGDDLVIIDAGTGIRTFGAQLRDAKTIHLFLGHTHWDHVLGFPFFAPIYNPNCQIHIWAPVGFEKTTRELFTEMLNYTYFPVRLDDIQAPLTFRDLHDGQKVTIGDIHIDMHYAYHPGSSLCFKITVGDKVIGYATDNEMFMGYHDNPASVTPQDPLLASYDSIIRFYQGCDLLIHEAQYFPLEYQKRVGWGHSSISNAAILIKHCTPKEWLITHHDPGHTDEDIFKKLQMAKDILEECNLSCPVEAAFDGLILSL